MGTWRLESATTGVVCLRWHSNCVGRGPDLANLISDSQGGGAEEAKRVFVVGSESGLGGARDDYASVISPRKCPLKNDQ